MKVKLKDIFDLQMGKTPSRNNSEYWNGDYKWISIKDISNANKYIYDTKEKITAKAIEDSKIKSIPANTVIMSFKLSIGKTSITKEKIYTNEAIMAFIDKKTLPIDINYIYYLLSNWNWNIITNKAVMGLTLNKSILSNLEIDLPSIDEQKKIANILDKVTNLIELRKKQLEKLDIFSKALFVEMFGDPILNTKNFPFTKLINIIKFQRGYDLPIQNRIKGDIPVYGANGILGYHSEYKFKNGIITGRSGSIGNVYYCERDFWPLNTTLFSIDMYDNNPRYLCYLLEKFSFKRFINGTGVPTLNRNVIHKEKIIDVPVELQNQFAKKVEHIDKIKLSIQDSLTKLETLKKSLMQEYFS